MDFVIYRLNNKVLGSVVLGHQVFVPRIGETVIILGNYLKVRAVLHDLGVRTIYVDLYDDKE